MSQPCHNLPDSHPSTTALFEVDVNGATAAWCVEKAVWIMTAAIGRVPSHSQ